MGRTSTYLILVISVGVREVAQLAIPGWAMQSSVLSLSQVLVPSLFYGNTTDVDANYNASHLLDEVFQIQISLQIVQDADRFEV